MLSAYKKHYIIILFCVLAALLTVNAAPVKAATSDAVVVLEVEGTITTGMLNFIERQINAAVKEEAQLVVIMLNTPGGLVDATMKINETILNAEMPIAALVAPSGAIAASAGAFILMSADIAAAAPGTTIGAAQPVVLSPEGSAPADDKTTTFLAEYLRTLAGDKERPADLAEKFVTENLTLNAQGALEVGLIEYLTPNLDTLLAELDGLEVVKQGRVFTLATMDAPRVTVEMNLREALQHWVSDPQIAFMLLMVGIMGIYFGLSAPGTFVPEIAGGILLVMGVYGMGLFDTNTTGIVLLLLGIALIVAEVLTAGFGVLGIGGAVCLVAGAIMLPYEPLMAADWYGGFRITVISTVVALTVIFLLIAQRVWHSRQRWKEGSEFFNPPAKGFVVEELSPQGMIKARGELWKAFSHDGSRIAVKTEVEVVRVEGLTLWVRPAQKLP